MGVESIGERLLSILLDNLGLGLIDELVLDLALGLLLDLSDLGVGVIDWCQFHI